MLQVLNPDNSSEYKEQNKKWSKIEELKLEHGFRLSKLRGDNEYERWNTVSSLVESKNPEQCEQKCIEMSRPP